jgi:hypothetical protein
MALNYQGFSVASESIRILAAEVPDAPGTPTKVDSDKTFITIRWTEPVYTGGVPVESYNVFARPNSDAYELITLHTDLSNLSYELTIPTENIGVTYQFKVTAINEVGEGAESVETSIIAGTIPGQTLSLVKVSSDTTQITLGWSVPLDDGGTPIINYQINWDDGLGSTMS